MTFSSAILPSSSRARTSTSLGKSSNSNCSDRVSLKSVLEETSVQCLEPEMEWDELVLAGPSIPERPSTSPSTPLALKRDASSASASCERPCRMARASSNWAVRS